MNQIHFNMIALDKIKADVQRELNIIMKPNIKTKDQVIAKKLFIALAIKKMDIKLKPLADYLGYKNHTSVHSHLINPSKGRIRLANYLQQDKKLWNIYNKLK